MGPVFKTLSWSILTWTRGFNHDHEGGSSRARLLHCTWEWLTPAISPNVGNLTSSFLLVGICVRANPFQYTLYIHPSGRNWRVGVRCVFLHLSSTCMATQGGAASQFFIVCLQLLLDSEVRNWFTRFFSSTYLPKPHSKSCQWQPQVHTSSKHTFVAAADLCFVTTGVIWMARAGDFNLSNSDLLEAKRLN